METSTGKHLGTEKQETSYAFRKAPIAAVFEDCIQYFEQLCAIVESNPEAWESISVSITDCFSKFRDWGGATKAPSRALDHALRKSSGLQETTRSLLEDLLSTLHITRESLQDATRLPITPAARIQALGPGKDYFSVKSTTTGERQPSSSASSSSASSIQQLTDDLDETIACLTRLLPTLQDPAPQDIYDGSSINIEASKDIELATSMFPKAPHSLVRRLGFSNWKRREYVGSLKLRSTQAKSARAQITERKARGDKEKLPNTGFSIIHSFASRPNRLAFSPVRTSFGEDGSSAGPSSVNDTVFSGTDYFSGYSETSIAESDHIEIVRRFEIPKPPVPLRPGSTFDCPYCGQEITFGAQNATNDDWALHVFMDLEPYQCTFDNCLRAHKTFGTQDDWFRHELDKHRLCKVWYCQSCDYEVGEKEDIELHLGEKHKEAVARDDLSTMATLCERYSDKALIDQSCPFCGISKLPSEALKLHIGDHLEQLALLSIQDDKGSKNGLLSPRFADITTDKMAKLELLNDFVDEQRGYFWKPTEEHPNDSTASSNVAFVEDSDEEAVGQNINFPSAQPATRNRSPRPPMQRRESWMTKVKTYLETRNEDQPRPELWKSKVESYLEHHSSVGESHYEAKSPIGEIIDQYNPDLAIDSANIVQTTRPFRTKPPPKDVDFVGREGDLVRLHKSLLTPGSVCILSGLGGIGKTAAAIEYTYRYEEAYSYIFWVSAETPISCADTYSFIATQFILSEEDVMPDQDRLITLGREFLEQTEKRWLLVFDNVDNWDDWINIQARFLPMNLDKSQGSVLVTTRWSKSVQPPSAPTMELGALTLNEGRQMLLLSMLPKLPKPSHEQLRSHPEYKLAGEIASLVDRLPLALAHIAGYVQVSGCSLTDFVQLWNERRRSIRNPLQLVDSSTVSTDKALETVWNIGLRDVTSDARELLNILAFLDSESIQRKLLVGEHEDRSLDFLHSDQAFRYKRMITELTRRRLITVSHQGEEEIIGIHRSLQRKILQDLGKNTQEVFGQAFALVRKRFPLPSPIQVPEPEKWPACKEYLPHVLNLEKVVTDYLPSIAPSVALARLLSDGGINLWERGMTGEGLRLLRSAEALLDKLDCEEDQLQANIHIIIALLIQDDGLANVAESKDRISKALQTRRHYRDQTPPEMYTRIDDILLHNAWSDYGCVLLQYNKYEEAEPIFRQCLQKYREWGSEEEIPYEYYKFNHHTSICRIYHHDFTEAIRFAEEGLRCISLATGQSSATNKTRFDLACTILQSGNAQRALELHMEVLEANIRQHGKFSFLTLQSYYAVGAACGYTGNLADAERWMRKALELERSRRGSWPEAAVARTEFHLSQILIEQGKDLEEAGTLTAGARATLSRLLPLVDPLVGVKEEDDLALFDHLQPVFDGRFTGQKLLKYVSKRDD